jgi:HEPN domain-containing protein
VLGHSVAALCQELRSRYPELDDRCNRWATLDQHYIPTRYPDALPGGTPADVYTLEQARSATESALEVLREMRART